MKHHHGHHPEGHHHHEHFDPAGHHGHEHFGGLEVHFRHHHGGHHGPKPHGPAKEFDQHGHFGKHRKHGHHGKFGKHGKHGFVFGHHGKRHGHHHEDKHHKRFHWEHHGKPLGGGRCRDGVSEMSKIELKAKRRGRWYSCDGNQEPEPSQNKKGLPVNTEGETTAGEHTPSVDQNLTENFGRLHLGRHGKLYRNHHGCGPPCCRKEGEPEWLRREFHNRKRHCCCCSQKNTEEDIAGKSKKGGGEFQPPPQTEQEESSAEEGMNVAGKDQDVEGQSTTEQARPATVP